MQCRAQRLPNALESGQRIDRIATIGFRERRLAAGVARAALGDGGAVLRDKAHADPAVVALSECVDGIVALRLRQAARPEPPLGRRGPAKPGDEARQAEGADRDAVPVMRTGFAEFEADPCRRQTGPERVVERDERLGMRAAGPACRPEQADRNARNEPAERQPIPVALVVFHWPGT